MVRIEEVNDLLLSTLTYMLEGQDVDSSADDLNERLMMRCNHWKENLGVLLML
jgi:hypothetical protein